MALPFTGVKVRVNSATTHYWAVANLSRFDLPMWEPWTPDLGIPDYRTFVGMSFYAAGRNPRNSPAVLWFGAGLEMLPAPDPENWPEPPLTSIEWGYMRAHPTVSKLRWGWLDPEGVRHEDSIFIPRHTWPITPETDGSIDVPFVVDLELSGLQFDAEAGTWSMQLASTMPYRGTYAPPDRFDPTPPLPGCTNELLDRRIIDGMRLARFPQVLGLTGTERTVGTPAGPQIARAGTCHTVTITGGSLYSGVWDGTDGGLDPWPAPIYRGEAMITPEIAAHECGMMGSPFRRIVALGNYDEAGRFYPYYDEGWSPADGETDIRTYEGRLATLTDPAYFYGYINPRYPNFPSWTVFPSMGTWDPGEERRVLWPETREWAGIVSGGAFNCHDSVFRYGLYTSATAGDTVALFTDPTGTVWNVSLEGDIIWVKHMQTDWKTWSSPLTVDSTGQYDSVAITGNGRVLYVNARRSTDETTFTFYSLDYGQTWDGPHLVGKDVA